MKRMLQNLGLSLLGLLAAVALFEIGYRLAASYTQKPASRPDRPTLYYMPENARRMSDGPYPAAKEPQTFRVSVVGDSFSFAPQMQYDDSFAKHLERRLNLNRSELRAEVINFGTPGFSSVHEVSMVRKALAVESNLIILQITLNDPQERPLSEEPSAVRGKFGRFSPRPRWRRLLGYWRSLEFALERIHNQRSIRAYTQYHFDLFEYPASWSRFSGALKKMASLSAAHRVPLIAVIFPLFDYPLDEKYPFLPLHKKITVLLASLHVPALDLYPAFRNMSPARLQLVPGQDHHPNEIAHRIAGDAIFQWLARRKLIPAALTARSVFRQRKNVKEPPLPLRRGR